MKFLEFRALHFLIFLVVVAVALPANAGRARSKAGIHHGHPQSHHGVAIFRRETRGLPNGVNIFHRPSHGSHGSLKKVGKRKKSHGKAGKRKHARNDRDRRGTKKRSKRKHDRPKKKHAAYGSTIYVATPENEDLYPENGEKEKCRHLTERGYDRSGRRVLVQWTLCFDEQGEPYVPADGRRIVARF